MPVLGVFSQGSAAKLYIPVTNVEASSLTLGYAVALRIAGASFNGNNAVMADDGNATDLPGFIGVADGDIVSNGRGLVQCWGWAASVFLSRTNTSVTHNQGDPLVPGAPAGGLKSAAPTYANSGFKFILLSNQPVTLSNAITASYGSGLVRCL